MKRTFEMKKVALAVAGLLVLGMVSMVPAFATHGVISLAGSNFEIEEDANIKLDDPAPSEDWESVPQGGGTGQERRGQDEPTGADDDSFGQGSKEDTPVPTVIDGSIPNNKSDLRFFGGYLEEVGTQKYLNIYWTRVQEPTGTTNMDFEFNKSDVTSANGVTPVRTAGDVLIQYDLTAGGTHPELFLSEWVTTGPGSQCEANNSTPCWGDRVNLTDAGTAVGSINTSFIPDIDSDGLGEGDGLDPFTFGEAQIDFDVFATGEDECVGFGSAYLKSRSSDSFTAALKDFIAPIELNFNECGAIQVTKTRKHAEGTDPVPHAGVVFTLSGNGVPAGTTATTNALGVACFDGVVIDPDAYTVTETVPPDYVSDDSIKEVTVSAVGSCASPSNTLTFVNTPLTDVTVSVDSLIEGGTASTIECTDPNEAVPPGDGKVSATTGAGGDGSLTVDDISPTAPAVTITCTITIDP